MEDIVKASAFGQPSLGHDISNIWSLTSDAIATVCGQRKQCCLSAQTLETL